MIETYEVVYNTRYGGFSFSKEFIEYAKEQGHEVERSPFNRHDRKMINLLKRFGLEKASGPYADLAFELVPINYSYRISDYDGIEEVIYAATTKGVTEAYEKGLDAMIDYCRPFIWDKF